MIDFFQLIFPDCVHGVLKGHAWLTCKILYNWAVQVDRIDELNGRLIEIPGSVLCNSKLTVLRLSDRTRKLGIGVLTEKSLKANEYKVRIACMAFLTHHRSS